MTITVIEISSSKINNYLVDLLNTSFNSISKIIKIVSLIYTKTNSI